MIYYKNGNSYLKLKSPVNNPEYIEITEQEFIQATIRKPLTQEQINRQNILKLISEKKKLLIKYREDIEQVDLFGMVRDDYSQKKTACVQLVLELRELEKGL